MGSTITDAEPAHRYEAHVEGDLAGFLDYIAKRGRIALVHTEVLPAYRGRGVAGELARFALDDARRRGLRVIASCPSVRAYVERHPETHDIVVGMTRA
jgi:predicted GNAT family acetyltransferase